MVEFRIRGFRTGLNKVAMTKAIREQTKHDLGAAKACTDAVLEGEEVSLFVSDGSAAAKLVKELNDLGANAEVVKN